MTRGSRRNVLDPGRGGGRRRLGKKREGIQRVGDTCPVADCVLLDGVRSPTARAGETDRRRFGGVRKERGREKKKKKGRQKVLKRRGSR